MARPIRNHGGKGDDCYDPFLGSGTTLIAAETLGRRCFAMELDPRYVDVSVTRWEKFSGKKAQRVPAAGVSENTPAVAEVSRKAGGK
jgi:DNA modification methylase